MYIQDHLLPPVLTNLAKAAEKQLKPDLKQALDNLAASYEAEYPSKAALEELRDSIQEKIAVNYQKVKETGTAAGDRGALRAFTWGQKVSNLHKSLIDRYLLKGEELTAGTELFLCEACGFILLGTAAPSICPICKAPEKRFTRID